MSTDYIIILISLAFSGFFSGMEIAFVTSNRLKIEMDKKNGVWGSRIVYYFIKHPGQYIATMLVGNNIALVIYGIFMALVLEPLIFTITAAEFNVLLIQTLLSTLIILITAEFLPKTLFRIDPNKALKIFSVPVFIFYWSFFPVTRFSMMVSNFFIRKISRNENNQHSEAAVFGKVDLAELITQGSISEEEDTIDNEIRIFQNALDFSEIKIRECTVPRNEIEAYEINDTIESLRKSFIKTGFSRILIYKETIDNIVGYVTSTQLFHNPKTIKDILINIIIVPETMTASKLLNRFLREQKSVAVVVDEFGGTAGMVTAEDIMEEIFGEIEDEHDTADYIERKIDNKTYEFSGRLEIDALNEKYKLKIPESDDYETLAGFILFHMERIPNENDEINIGAFHFKILKIENPKIELVRMHLRYEN